MSPRAEGLLAKMRRTQAGFSQTECGAVLEHFGFEVKREANHGTFYRHPELAAHEDLAVRKLALVQVPKGRTVREYVPRSVVESVDAVQTLRKERGRA